MKTFWSGVEIRNTYRKMTTTADQRQKMRKLPEHSPVRRRLFDAEPHDHAVLDNFANILQESCRIDRINMIKKYNFDIKHEEPLEGPWEWYRKDQDSWMIMKPLINEDTFIPIDKEDTTEKENQMTPRVLVVEVPPVVRKRKRDGSFSSDTGVKRKISFD